MSASLKDRILSIREASVSLGYPQSKMWVALCKILDELATRTFVTPKEEPEHPSKRWLGQELVYVGGPLLDDLLHSTKFLERYEYKDTKQSLKLHCHYANPDGPHEWTAYAFICGVEYSSTARSEYAARVLVEDAIRTCSASRNKGDKADQLREAHVLLMSMANRDRVRGMSDCVWPLYSDESAAIEAYARKYGGSNG